MPIVELDDQEWQQVMAIIATAPWRDANPLLMKLGNQLRVQQRMQPHHDAAPDPISKQIRTDGKEQHHE
jgi:hypothetical protein